MSLGCLLSPSICALQVFCSFSSLLPGLLTKLILLHVFFGKPIFPDENWCEAGLRFSDSSEQQMFYDELCCSLCCCGLCPRVVVSCSLSDHQQLDNWGTSSTFLELCVFVDLVGQAVLVGFGRLPSGRLWLSCRAAGLSHSWFSSHSRTRGQGTGPSWFISTSFDSY